MHRDANRCGLHAIARHMRTPMHTRHRHSDARCWTHRAHAVIAFFIGESRDGRHRRAIGGMLHDARPHAHNVATMYRAPGTRFAVTIAGSHPLQTPPRAPKTHAISGVRIGMSLPAYCRRLAASRDASRAALFRRLAPPRPACELSVRAGHLARFFLRWLGAKLSVRALVKRTAGPGMLLTEVPKPHDPGG